MAPAALAAISERRRSSSRAKKRPMLEATLAPIWTMGPSRPPEAPVPSDTAEATSLPGPTIGRMRPPRTAMAIITLEIPDPRASGTAFHVSRPTTSPPRAGISRTAGTSGSDPKETSWTASTSMISATASSPVTRPTTAARATITASLPRRAMSSARMRRTARLRPSERAKEEIWSGARYSSAAHPTAGGEAGQSRCRVPTAAIVAGDGSTMRCHGMPAARRSSVTPMPPISPMSVEPAMTLPPVEQLDDVTTRVLAPNPSPMTLEGTNTYLLGVAGSGEVLVVDPGPDLLEHRRAVDGAVAARDAQVVAVVVTHHHADHAEAAGWAAQWGAPLHCFTPSLVVGVGVPDVSAAPAEVLRDGARLARAGLTLEALHTPGHASDHLCLRVLDTDAVLTGDHVLGRGTTVVAWPDGNMTDYIASLRRLGELPATALHPGHGPVLDDPAATVRDRPGRDRAQD